MARKTVKRVKTGAFERRFSLARAGFMAGARYATATAGTLLVPADKRAEHRRHNLSERANELVDELGQLKGSVVKIGQMMALFGEHFLPPEVTQALHTLEDSTAALAWPSVREHLEEQLGPRLEELSVSPEPLGAASLSQVHRATRKSDGAQLVLKVQYPGVADAIDSDMHALVSLLRLSRLVPITRPFNQWLDEVREMLKREVDYHLEAGTTRHFREALRDDPRFVVPQVYDRYCTGEILCLSYEEGVPITDSSVVALTQKRRNFLGRAIMELCCREVFEWDKMQTDPNFGNYLMQIGENGQDRIVLLDFGAIRDFDDEILGPGREMIRASWHHDTERLIRAMNALHFLSGSVPRPVLEDFAVLCFEAIEALQDPDRFPPPASVVSDKGEYLWGESDLPNRVLNRTSRTALSAYFDVPPREFIFLFRKLLGAYTFLHVIQARVRGNTILEPYITMNEEADRAIVERRLGNEAG